MLREYEVPVTVIVLHDDSVAARNRVLKIMAAAELASRISYFEVGEARAK